MDKLIIAILNGAIGDQYGLPFEMMCKDTIKNLLKLNNNNNNRHEIEQQCETNIAENINYYISDYNKDKPYTYSDDTNMTLAVLNAIIDNSIITNYTIIKYYVKHFEPFRGYCIEYYNIMYNYFATDIIKTEELELNGGLMRVLPIVKLINQYSSILDIENIVKVIHYPEHLHYNAIYVSACYITLMYNIMMYDVLNEINLINLIIDVSNKLPLKYTIIKEKLLQLTTYFIEKNKSNEEELIDNLFGLDGIRADETLTISLFINIKYFKQPDKIINYAILQGGDTDTIAAISGQIAGMIHGIKAINKEWFYKLERNDIINNLLLQHVSL